MDHSAKEELVNADLPRRSDPQGDEPICAAEHFYDKYPPFSRGRIQLALVLLGVGALLAGLHFLVDELS